MKNGGDFIKGFPPLNSMNFFNFGPYLVTSLWMLKMTFSKFPLYLISNTILHILFTFLGLKYLKSYKIASLVKLTRIQYIAINFLRALFLYGFQYINDFSHSKKALFNKLSNCEFIAKWREFLKTKTVALYI